MFNNNLRKIYESEVELASPDTSYNKIVENSHSKPPQQEVPLANHSMHTFSTCENPYFVHLLGKRASPQTSTEPAPTPALSCDRDRPTFHQTFTLTPHQHSVTIQKHTNNTEIVVDGLTQTSHRYHNAITLRRIHRPHHTPFPHLHRSSVTFVRSIAEILSGQRAPQQLIRWMDEGLYPYFLHRVHAEQSHANLHGRKAGRTTVLTIHTKPTTNSSNRAIYAECYGTVWDGHRIRLICMSMKHMDKRWVIQELEIG
ncbi:MAG: Rv3235 family protein [Actinomycetaceae bacterium]|nr:Rv3235 family protein [Actinomycetaceae bacterium]